MMEQTKTSPGQKEDEISLKDLILVIKEWIGFLLKKWKIILLFGILGAALGVLYSLTQKINYKAELTFVLEDNKSGALGMYAGIASQMGFNLGGGEGGGVFSGDNIQEFLKSRMIIEKTLLSPVDFNKKSISLAELYSITYELDKSWANNPELRNIHFPPNANRATFNLKQDSLLNVIYTRIVNANLKVGKPDKVASFIAVTCTSPSELFSKKFTEHLVYEATDFYVATKTKRSKTYVDKLQLRADSIETILNRKTYSAAAAQDLNLNPVRRVATVNTELATLDKVVLQTMYTEVLKNLEISKMSMAQETPLIQIIDTPILPLKKERFGKLKGILLGGILGGFLIVGWLVIRRIYKKIMA